MDVTRSVIVRRSPARRLFTPSDYRDLAVCPDMTTVQEILVDGSGICLGEAGNLFLARRSTIVGGPAERQNKEGSFVCVGCDCIFI